MFTKKGIFHDPFVIQWKFACNNKLLAQVVENTRNLVLSLQVVHSFDNQNHSLIMIIVCKIIRQERRWGLRNNPSGCIRWTWSGWYYPSKNKISCFRGQIHQTWSLTSNPNVLLPPSRLYKKILLWTYPNKIPCGYIKLSYISISNKNV